MMFLAVIDKSSINCHGLMILNDFVFATLLQSTPCFVISPVASLLRLLLSCCTWPAIMTSQTCLDQYDNNVSHP